MRKLYPVTLKNGLTILQQSILLFPFRFLKQISRKHFLKQKSKGQILSVDIPTKEIILK